MILFFQEGGRWRQRYSHCKGRYSSTAKTKRIRYLGYVPKICTKQATLPLPAYSSPRGMHLSLSMHALPYLSTAKVPRLWAFTITGDEFSWILPTLGLWFSSLITRDEQDRAWLNNGRPTCYWLTGFFNPQASNRRTSLTHHLLYWRMRLRLETISWLNHAQFKAQRRFPPANEGDIGRPEGLTEVMLNSAALSFSVTLYRRCSTCTILFSNTLDEVRRFILQLH